MPCQIERIMAFDIEKQRVLEKKLRDRFLSNIETEFIQLHALRSGQTVSSFRTVFLRDSLVASLRQVCACTVLLRKILAPQSCPLSGRVTHSFVVVLATRTGALSAGWREPSSQRYQATRQAAWFVVCLHRRRRRVRVVAIVVISYC
jgi:hypothetical protein